MPWVSFLLVLINIISFDVIFWRTSKKENLCDDTYVCIAIFTILFCVMLNWKEKIIATYFASELKHKCCFSMTWTLKLILCLNMEMWHHSFNKKMFPWWLNKLFFINTITFDIWSFVDVCLTCFEKAPPRWQVMYCTQSTNVYFITLVKSSANIKLLSMSERNKVVRNNEFTIY